MKISQILAEKHMTLSFEFFPPKEKKNEGVLFDTIEVLKKYNPDFVSITYGAGGSTQEKTIDWTIRMKGDYDLNPMMHLTCITSTRKSIDGIVSVLEENGIDNILALRGDLPKGSAVYPQDFRYAYQLVEYLKSKWQFSVGVAGYPEGHPESPSLEKDVEYLKMKIDAGGDFIITQLFFDNRYFFEFIDRLEKHGVHVPVLAGIMPITSLSQVQRFVEMCGATIPEGLLSKLKDNKTDEVYRIGVEHATQQCSELIENGVRGLHFYTLNRHRATREILEMLRI